MSNEMVEVVGATSLTDASAPDGALSLVGQLRQASNATFLAVDQAGRFWCHKPIGGERPLSDFPDGTLANREVVAYLLSERAGFDLVPPTVLVEGPLGPGSAQLWMHAGITDLVELCLVDQIEPDWFGLVIGEDAQGQDVAISHAHDPRLRRMALFDAVSNNADRKGQHILQADPAPSDQDVPEPDASDQDVAPSALLVGVDQGLTFHHEPKLRTVLWGWQDEPLLDDEVALLGRCLKVLDAPNFAELLDARELEATAERIQTMLERGRLPALEDHWPAIPWPPL